MDTNTWIALGGFLFTIIVTIVTVAIAYGKAQQQLAQVSEKASEVEKETIDKIKRSSQEQDLKLANSKLLVDSEIRSLNASLNTQKDDIKRLEVRVTDHKDKIAWKIDGLEDKIERRDNILSNKIDELKDLIINKLDK